jgi:hypothetical protein
MTCPKAERGMLARLVAQQTIDALLGAALASARPRVG